MTPMLEYTNSKLLKRSQVVAAVALSTLAAAVFCLIDCLSIAFAGDGVPLVLFPMLLLSYVGAACFGGLLLGVLPASATVAGDDRAVRAIHQGRIQRPIICVILALVAAMFHERLVEGEGRGLGRSLSGISIAMVAFGALIAVGTARRSRATGAPLPVFVWRVMVLAAACTLWPPFNYLYRASWLSATSIIWNAGYLVAGIVLYGAGVLLIRGVVRPKREFSTAQCLKITAVIAVAALAVPGAIWLIVQPAPIERDGPPVSNLVAVDQQKRPNIVLIVMDTTRADHLSVYGYNKNTTPHLLAFSKEAQVYAHAVAPAPWTLPSHASMFTGLLPTEHGATYHLRDAGGRTTRGLPDAAMTLAEILAAQGYDTAGIVGNWVMLNRQYGMDQGFQYYDDRRRAALTAVEPDVLAPSQWLCGLVQHVVGRSEDARSAEEVNESVFAWLDRPRKKPFFLFINYLDPHHPYQSHPEFEDSLGASPPSGAITRTDATARRVPEEQAQSVALYDQEIAYMDANIGRLFTKLKAEGLYDSSLIVVTSDHGEAFGEHGHLYHSNSLYEEEIRVPLLIRYPSGKPRGMRHATTSLVTLSETILTHLGIDRPANGAPDAMDVGDAVVSELHFAEPKTDRYEQWVTRSIYVAGGTKVIIDATPAGEMEVYDLVHDPCETENLLMKQTDLAAVAGDRVRRVAADAFSRQLRPDFKATLSSELMAQLRTLGYVTE